MAAAAKKVCVTGAGGFVASWVVKLLLSKGYIVHGTVRQPGNQKYDHLLKLDRASENLRLFKADILNYESVYSTVVGCSAVFHVASPVPSTTVTNPEVEVIEPAVKGTANVLKAALEAKVERVVFVSSVAAVYMNPSLPRDKVIDESCWSDKGCCKQTKNWYYFSKTEAELQALEFAKTTGLFVIQSLTLATFMTPVSYLVIKIMAFMVMLLRSTCFTAPKTESCETLENKLRWIVDVRDLADAILLSYEKLEAEGRYICTSHSIKTKDLVEKLKSIYPNYSYPANYIEVDDCRRLSSEKLQRLGWRYRSLEETLVDSVESYKEAGILESR